jgi:Cytochrome c7 and related cytochrome c
MMTNYNMNQILTRFLSILGAALILVVVFSSMMISSGTEDKNSLQKTVKFNHEKHIKDIGAQCEDCHTNAETSLAATDNLLAKMSACQSCHEDQEKSNCTYCHLSADSTTYAATPNPVRELVFSHKLHVEDQKVACQTCHTELDKETATVGELVPSMKVCSSCHDGVKQKDDCAACHTNMASLRPNEHNRSDFIRDHKFAARKNDAACGTCHSQETCIDCHNGVCLVQVNVQGTNLMSPHSPRLTANDRGQGMVIQKVHDLNYKFTHGIDAKSKSLECQTCHSTEQFCTPCHQAGGNVNQGAFKPASHMVAGFTTSGVGSGGGEHARLAKRDIETCAACHGVEGADPACVMCHRDPDGMKGNDPRTHAPGFLSNQHGPWHSDPGATCYICHTDANAHPGGIKGQKFCGYCHN